MIMLWKVTKSKSVIWSKTGVPVFLRNGSFHQFLNVLEMHLKPQALVEFAVTPDVGVRKGTRNLRNARRKHYNGVLAFNWERMVCQKTSFYCFAGETK